MPLYNLEIEVQGKFDVEVLMVGNIISSSGGEATVTYSPDPTSGAATETLESGDTIIPVTVQKGLKDSGGVDIVAETSVLKKLGESEDARQVAPDGLVEFRLKDTDGNTLADGSVSVKSNSTESAVVIAPDSTINIQKQDSTPSDIGAVIPITAKSNETKAVNVPVADATINIQRKDTGGNNIGAVIPVSVKAEATQAQDVEAPDSTVNIQKRNTSGTDIGASESNLFLSNSSQTKIVTVEDGTLRDSDNVDVLAPSGAITAIADTSAVHSDLSGQVYDVPKFSNVTLPKISLTVGATTHDYETSDFTFSSSPSKLTKVIDDIAGGVSGCPITKSVNLYETNAYARTADVHPWYIERGDTKSVAFRFKYNIDPVASTNTLIFGNRRSDISSGGLRVSYFAPGIIGILLISTSGPLTNMNFTIPSDQYVLKDVWNSLVVVFNNTRATNVSVYLNGRSLAVSSTSSDTLTSGTCLPNTGSGINAEFQLDNTTFNSNFVPRNAKWGEIQMIDAVLTAAQALEFHERRRADIADFTYQASIDHRYISRDDDITTTTFTDEVTGLHPFTITNGTNATTNYDAA
jgi:hypothetical protein